jgi:hypothetical protein
LYFCPVVSVRDAQKCSTLGIYAVPIGHFDRKIVAHPLPGIGFVDLLQLLHGRSWPVVAAARQFSSDRRRTGHVIRALGATLLTVQRS